MANRLWVVEYKEKRCAWKIDECAQDLGVFRHKREADEWMRVSRDDFPSASWRVVEYVRKGNESSVDSCKATGS